MTSNRSVVIRVLRTLGALVVSIASTSSVYAEDLKIGATLALSGAYADYGQNALRGIELAVEEVNSRGGVQGRNVRLIVEDEGTLDLKAALGAARKLVDVDKVEILFPLIIEDSEVIVPFTSTKSVFTMAVGCGARKCGANVGPYHVRAPSSHDEIIETLVAHAQSLAVKHACIVAAQSTYFEAYGKYIEELARAAKMDVTYEGVPLSNSEDYRSTATRFTHSSCDAIFAWIPMGSVGGFMRRVREAGSKAVLFGIVETDDPGVLKAAGAAAEGAVFARFSLGSASFQKRFRARFGREPARPAVPSYDGVKLVLELAAKVGTNAKQLREAVSSISKRPAENGVVTFSADGERTGEIVELMRIEQGRPVSVVPAALSGRQKL